MNTPNLHNRLLPLAVVVALFAAAPTSQAGILEEFLFNDANGTLIEEAENNINLSHGFSSNVDNASIVTNGLGQLNASLKSNVNFGTNYIDIDPVTTGVYWGVMELTWDFQSALDTAENEEIRLSFINNQPPGTQITAEYRIERNDSDDITIRGLALPTDTSDDTGVTVLNGGSLTQSQKFIAVLKADLSNNNYEVSFSNNGGTSFVSAGNAALDPDRGIEAIRLGLNNDLSNDNILIDRLYFTDVNPIPPVDRLLLQVNTVNGELSLINDTASSFDINWYRITSDDDSLEFDNWDSLSDQAYDAIDGPIDGDLTVGNGIGETWDEAGGSDDGVLSESFLQGSSVFDPTDEVSLGLQSFKVPGGDIDSLVFEYRDRVSGNVFTGRVEPFTPTGLMGDYNGNDVIDAADYTVWRDALTAGSTSLLNDPTPGVVNESDFTYWRSHFGESLGSGAGSATTAIPEPGSLLLALCAGLAACVMNVRRRGR